MRFLILGSSGMAGHMLCTYLCEVGHSVTGYARRRCAVLNDYIRQVEGDAMDGVALAQEIQRGRYDIVVNAVGLLNEVCDKQPARAIYLNSYLPHRLVELTANMGTRVFHMSTDCVFAGNTGPYKETSIPDGPSTYDRTKALGELGVTEEKNLTLRQSIVGPDPNPNGIGLLNWFMKQEGQINGFANAIWTGLTTLELAHAVEACAKDGSCGLVNMVPEGLGISKLDLLGLLNRHLRGDAVRLVPVEEPHLDKTLVRENRVPPFRPAPYEEQVRELALWMDAHASMYPHYRLDVSNAR